MYAAIHRFTENAISPCYRKESLDSVVVFHHVAVLARRRHIPPPKVKHAVVQPIDAVEAVRIERRRPSTENAVIIHDVESFLIMQPAKGIRLS